MSVSYEQTAVTLVSSDEVMQRLNRKVKMPYLCVKITQCFVQEDDQKRHLLRLWISPTNDRPLPDQYEELLGGSVTPGARGGIVVAGTDLKVTAEAE